VSFLDELKSQAAALQSRQAIQNENLEVNTAQTEAASQLVWKYLQDLSRQLNVIAPQGPDFSLDGKTPWPPMKLVEFRVDSRKKKLRDKDVYDYIAIGWNILPQSGAPVAAVVSVNFPPDLERVQKRLAVGHVEHERKDQRHPEKNTLQAIHFEYITKTRGNVMVTPDHDQGQLHFRLANASGFGVDTTTWPASRINYSLMDELAKLIVAQPSRFL
jgi:hypothetical protein